MDELLCQVIGCHHRAPSVRTSQILRRGVEEECGAAACGLHFAQEPRQRGFLIELLTEMRRQPSYRRMEHIQPPEAANYWWLDLNKPRTVVTNEAGEPILTITVREISGEKVALQLSVAPGAKISGGDPGNG